MTDKEILQKAIDKANNSSDEFFPASAIYNIIFSHSFAKAFWGTEDVIHDFGWGNVVEAENWEIELMIMVREKEPLKYLEKFL